jgi:hypothetical protein
MGFRCIARCTTVDAESADIFRTLFGASLNNYWLDSKRSDSVKARFSFMGDDSGPHAFVVSQRVGRIPATYSRISKRRLMNTRSPTIRRCRSISAAAMSVISVMD